MFNCLGVSLLMMDCVVRCGKPTRDKNKDTDKGEVVSAACMSHCSFWVFLSKQTRVVVMLLDDSQSNFVTIKNRYPQSFGKHLSSTFNCQCRFRPLTKNKGTWHQIILSWFLTNSTSGRMLPLSIQGHKFDEFIAWRAPKKFLWSEDVDEICYEPHLFGSCNLALEFVTVRLKTKRLLSRERRCIRQRKFFCWQPVRSHACSGCLGHRVILLRLSVECVDVLSSHPPSTLSIPKINLWLLWLTTSK